jgi:uncharacterized membrane protein
VVNWFSHTLRGICMGIADVIPGVSGGTLALILGIYERFIGALSAVGPGMLRALFSRELWRRMSKGLRRPGDEGDDEVGTYAGQILFLAFLVVGIGMAVLVGARFIPGLLDRYPTQMKAFFLGLVAASVVIPYRLMAHRGWPQLASCVVAGLMTYVLVGLPVDQSQRSHGEILLQLPAPVDESIVLRAENVTFLTERHQVGHEKREVTFGLPHDITIPAQSKKITVPVIARMTGDSGNLSAGQIRRIDGGPAGATVRQPNPTTGGVNPSLGFVFIAGCIAISAMVLPGISGSFILLMLGLYHYMTFTLRSLVYDRQLSALMTAAVFGCALVVGITTFSRFLRWLLNRYHDLTMAALVGLMLGSLRKIWPFTTVQPDGTTLNTLPSEFDSTSLFAICICVLGVLIVWTLDRIGRKHQQPSPKATNPA